RRILRRAVRSGRELGFEGPFMHEVCDAVVENFQHVYPSLRLKGREAATTIRQEEERFFRTLERGIALFEERIDSAKSAGDSALSGADVFQLYDTFGFPADLTEIMAQERGMSVDMAGYVTAMQEQKERSRAADSRYEDAGEWRILAEGAANTFVGYNKLEVTTSVLRFREHDGRVDLTLRESPFYAESGGQVGDAGEVTTEDGSVTIVIDDTRKTTAGITLSGYLADGRLDSEKLSQPVTARVDASRRADIAAHHTATHLLHTALHKHVSKDAFQAGSLVAPDRLRFDFSYERPVTDDQVARIEAWVNGQIEEDDAVIVHEDIALSEAEERGAMMMFGEKYGERVRMVQVSDYSLELCGGTHVQRTGALGYFRVVAESGVAAGTRRIEAIVGASAIAAAEADRAQLRRLAHALKSPTAQLEDRVAKLDAENRELERKLQSLTQVQANAVAGDLVNQAVDVAGVAVLAAEVQSDSRDALLAMADGLRDKLPESAIALLAAKVDGKPALIVMVTDAAFKGHKIKAGDLINDVASHVGGRGGGRPTLAQAGGSKPEGIADAIAAFVPAVQARLS
ncbi:MAG: alanyl-tRNA synthetase, partial [Flavobacteriales bacterium]